MKVNYIILKTLLFVFILSSCVPNFSNQKDFYGTWYGTATDEEGTLIIKIVLSKTNIKAEIKVIFFLEDEDDIIFEDSDALIISWTASTNDDIDTENNFPDGFILKGISRYDDDFFMDIYISKNKKQLIIPQLNQDAGDIMIFNKL